MKTTALSRIYNFRGFGVKYWAEEQTQEAEPNY